MRKGKRVGSPPGARFGRVAVIGPANGGKSTLVNAIVGKKVTIVTAKAQTTRLPIAGIACLGDTQIVLADTAGWMRPRRGVERLMMRAARSRLDEADCRLVLVDAARREAVRSLATTVNALESCGDECGGRRAQNFLVMNKIDLVPRPSLLPLAAELVKIFPFDRIFMISARTGNGLGALKEELVRVMPLGRWRYGADQAADLPMRLFAAELTREKLLERLHEEMPYAMAVETESWRRRPDRSLAIVQNLYVERAGQRAIVIGKGGQTLRDLGMGARREMAALFDCTVHLRLHVRLRADWRNAPDGLGRLGSSGEAR